MHFHLLDAVATARATYGLRQHDHARYRSHCASKVHRLRTATGLQQCTKSLRYASKPVTSANASTAQHLHLVLFQAERAWADAQLLKTSLDAPGPTSEPRHRMHLRLLRQAQLAERLTALCSVLQLDSPQLAQAHIYHLTALGTLDFERARFAPALDALTVAHRLLSLLATSAQSSKLQALALQWARDIAPIVRFCAYKLELDSTLDVEALVDSRLVDQALLAPYAEVVQGLKTTGGVTEDLSFDWRGGKIEVRQVEMVLVLPQIKAVLSSVLADQLELLTASAGKRAGKGPSTGMNGARMALFDRALLVLGEAEELARSLVTPDESSPDESVHEYLLYQLHSTRALRDLLLIRSSLAQLAATLEQQRVAASRLALACLASPATRAQLAHQTSTVEASHYPGLIRLYGNMLASISAILALPLVETDEGLTNEAQQWEFWTKGRKAELLGRTLALGGRWRDALVVLEGGRMYSRRGRALVDHMDDAEMETEPGGLASLIGAGSDKFELLEKELSELEERFKKAWSASMGASIEAVEGMGMEGLQLGEQQKEEPKIKVYDVAFSFVTAFDLEGIARAAAGEVREVEDVAMQVEEDEAPVEQEEIKVETPSKKGWGFGLFSR